MPVRSKWQSLPTEAINAFSLGIDKLDPDDLVDLMINEDRKMLEAVQRERERIAVGIEMVATALRKGGRIVFVGAGTSGRLGILESAEMPPTFSTDPLNVQAIMAGGRDAIFSAKEGVEDNYEEGARAITRLRPTKKDVVIGVSASGMTQFVRGALTRARKTGARIIFVTCDPGTELQTFVDLTIAPGVGAEIIAGSTRLKAGTATKMVLNMLTTGAMVRIGKTYGNLMVDVQTGSEKLKDRARRIVNIVTGLEYDEADRAAEDRTVEREGSDRHAEDRACRTSRRSRGSVKRTIRCARRLAKTSSLDCAVCSRVMQKVRPSRPSAVSRADRPHRSRRAHSRDAAASSTYTSTRRCV